ncbi:hypothetical protein DRP53_07160 [candidate division WOR-3 bacterium]|uniref:Uncharacterized protein n=1 Tax=candidate division WOR-3 bacterium TaxID=2052148 RepID=A0A660SGF6_UNCW3|nr:MAG: hypothetical protein DRP53_07160 [candidate division WOR-3 bacterium]
MKYLSAILFTVSLALGYLPSSFRNLSTAGVFDDDYDLMLDPGRIPEIEGYRLYTNLSNLVTGLERPFVNQSVNYFLLGGSGEFMKHRYLGLIFDNYSLNDPLPTGLFTREGDTIFGDGEVVNTQWLDTDGDGSFDYIINDREHRSAWDRNRELNFYLGLAFGKDNRFGFGFIHEDDRLRNFDPQVNYQIEREESTLIETRLTYLKGDTLTTMDETNHARNSIIFSSWFGRESAFNLSLGLGMIQSDSLTEADGYYFEDRNPGGDTLDYVKISSGDTFHIPYSGFEIPARIGLLKKRTGGWESEYYLDFRYLSLGVTGDGARNTISMVDSTCRPGTASGYDSITTTYSGKRSGYTVRFSTRQRFTLSKRFAFGFGLSLTNSVLTDELFDSTAQSGRYAYDDGDGVSTANDSTVTYTEMEYWQKKTTSVVRSISIPVGMEFKLIEPVTLRLGARHTTTYYDVVTTENLKGFDPRKTRVEYGDGSYSEWIDDEKLQSGTREEDSPTTHKTDYYYGLGIAIGKNLQLDLMYFNNLVNLANWRLSATLKF